MKPLKKKFQYGNHEVILETGQIARQANGAVLVNMEGTVVLTTVVAKNDGKARDFFPLTVNYMEKTYAAGKIPGGFFKREGRPNEKETLTSRLIDRPLRPLFPEGFTNEVQVVATVMSLNPDIDPDIPALLGASAAVSLSGMPFSGPIGAARVGYINGEYVLNPTLSVLEESDLDLVVAGTDQAVLMVESEADQLSEEIMLGAVVYGHEQMQTAINAIKEFKEEAVALVTEQGYSVSEAAKAVGVKDKLIYNWKKKIEDEKQGKALSTEEKYELSSLRKEVKRLRMEKEILKKASAFFAREMK